jgi:hypothetical protein
MDMPEEEHFKEIFNGLYINPKDVKLIEVLVKELTGESGAMRLYQQPTADGSRYTFQGNEKA